MKHLNKHELDNVTGAAGFSNGGWTIKFNDDGSISFESSDLSFTVDLTSPGGKPPTIIYY